MESATEPYPEPHKSSLYSQTLLFNINFSILIIMIIIIFKVVSSRQVFWLKFCIHF